MISQSLIISLTDNHFVLLLRCLHNYTVYSDDNQKHKILSGIWMLILNVSVCERQVYVV